MNGRRVDFYRVCRWMGVGVLVAGVGAARADVPNTATLDGRPLEYDAAELVGSFTNAPAWGANNVMSNLYVTWDSDNLYIALHGYSRPPENNKLAVLVDVDPGKGTGATTTTNWINTGSTQIDYNDLSWEALGTTPFGMDYMVASEGSFNNVMRTTYDGIVTPVLDTNVFALLDTDNGPNPTGAPLDMATREGEGAGCNLLAMEASIPWTTLYDPAVTNGLGGPRFGEVGPGHVLPTGAVVRVIAMLHNNTQNNPWNNPDTIPVQVSPGTSYAGGFQVTDDYIDVIIDGDSNGVPDDIGLGDVTGPWIKNAVGAEGATTVLLQFNEDLDAGFLGTPTNILINGATAAAATLDAPTLVRVQTSAPLPSGASASLIQVYNATDAGMNSRTLPAERCFFPSSGGITNEVDVTFVLNTASGMGLTPGVTSFYVNGGAFPLEFGFPPATSTPMTQVGATAIYTARVTFVAGSPSTFSYKYSATLPSGTNNYEAIRLDNYDNVSRPITLPGDGSPLVVTNDLGAAAGPARTGDTGYDALYADARRGDAGVRQRHTILFKLDLSLRALPANNRVVVQGSDPLRGFNSSASGQNDFASDGLVGWTQGGVELFDDGMHGDELAGDGIYSRLWSATDSGSDPLLTGPETGAPHSLVGGEFTTPPYFGGGTFWLNRRSPRSFIYKFYVKDLDEPTATFFESPSENLSYYIEDSADTNIVLDTFVWEGSSPPFLNEINEATIVSVTPGASNVMVVLTNIVTATENTVEFAEDLVAGVFHNYGQAAVGSDGVFTAVVTDVANPFEAIQVRTPGNNGDFTWWEPNPLPPTGGMLRVYFNQNRKNTAGANPVYWYGAFTPEPGAPFSALPMSFDGDGQWHIDVNVPSNDNGHVQFLVIDTDGFVAGTKQDKNRHVDGSNAGSLGGDYGAMIGGRASWAPDPVVPGEDLTITYNKAGGPLANEPDINIWLDYDGWEELLPWNGALHETPMVQTGDTNVYEVTVTVPTSTKITASFVFKTPPLGSSAGQQFDGNPAPTATAPGRDWNAFVRP